MFYISVSTRHLLLKLLLHTTYGHKGHFWAHNETGAHKLVCMHTVFFCAWAHIFAQLCWTGWFRYLWDTGDRQDISEQYWDLCTQASVHAHCILACFGPYLGSIVSNQKNWGINETRGTYRSFLSTYWHLFMQASVHAHCILACFGPYLCPIVLDQGDWGIYEIREQASHFLAHIKTCVGKLVCINTVFLRVWAHIMAKLCWIRVNEVSMRSGGYAGHFLTHIEACACKLVCRHTVF